MANRVNNIFPECYVDTNILKTLLHLDGVNHQHGCSKVMLGMKKGKFAEGFAIGVIQELAKSEHLTLMKHKEKHHYLIFVCKAAEDFLLSCANELQLDLSEYDLPSTLEELKEVTKNTESDKDARIKRLINALRDSSEMSRLDRTVNYLQDKQFAVDIKELTAIFSQ